jgi:hypothetical protein
MSDTSPKLSLPFIAPSQAMKHVTHNEALLRLDAITQLSVEALGATTPPATPQDGVCYGLGVAAQDAWLGHDGEIALFSNGGWQFLTPQPGWRAWNQQTTRLMVYSASQWLAIDLSLDNVDGVGINSSYDLVNRLALASEASLFSHEGAGHQLKINKAAETDTAALLFQSGFTGHAEIGLAGDTDLAFKVSEDGSNFTTALSARAHDGLVQMPCLRSGFVTVFNDSVVTIPTPGDGGMFFLSLVNPRYPQTPHSAIFAFDSGVSLSLMTMVAGNGIDNEGSLLLTGTAGGVGSTNVSVQSDAIQIENRYNSESNYTYTFINAY